MYQNPKLVYKYDYYYFSESRMHLSWVNFCEPGAGVIIYNFERNMTSDTTPHGE